MIHREKLIETPSALEIVLAYARRGWFVFPIHSDQNARCSCSAVDCDRVGKHPRTAHGLNDASRDESQIRQWAEQFPDCNWGVRTGRDSGIFVLDVDGAIGSESLHTFQQKHGTEWADGTLQTETPHGGHLYFQYPANLPEGFRVKNSTGEIANDLDIRGAGGYVLVPPSKLHDGHYRWANDVPILTAPDWLLQLVIQASHLAPTGQPQSADSDGGAFPEGQRNTALTSLAGAMRKRAMSPAAIEAALQAENIASCKPPLSASEVSGIAMSVSRYAPDAAADAPKFSDDAIALEFTKGHGDDLKYTATMSRWFGWTGTHYQNDETLRVFTEARNTCRAVANVAEPDKARRLASSATVSAVERLARFDPRHAVRAEQWDSDPWALNTPAGTVDLHTGVTRAHRREDYITKITPVSPGGDCPLWIRFLERVTAGDSGLQSFLQRTVGYALTGSTREHALLFFYGLGANGKSVFVSTWMNVLGPYAKTTPVEMLMATRNASERHPCDMAALAGARLVTANEVERGGRWAESKLKALTGGDVITARFMHSNFFEYAPQFKLVVVGNHRPSLRSVDEAIRRRFYLVPFSVTIPPAERDPDLVEKLKAEYSGILAWAIEGCLTWQRDGLNPPAIVRDETDNYFGDEDALGRWIAERCVLDPSETTSSTALFASWSSWTESVGEFTGSQKAFAQQLAARNEITSSRTSRERVYRGIRLRNSSDEFTPSVRSANDGGEMENYQ